MAQIPFALKDGKPVDIKQVEKGLACGCVCPECHSSLIARQGDDRVHHFAHQAGAVCQNAYETSIHIMAKHILIEEKRLQLPGLQITVKDSNKLGYVHVASKVVCEARWVQFDEVKQEVTLDKIRADIVGYVNQHPLIIEICVTHASDKNKKRFIREQAWAAVEIDLAKLNYLADREQLTEHLLDSIKNKYWLAHPRVPSIKQKLKQQLSNDIQKENQAYDAVMERNLREQEAFDRNQATHNRQTKLDREPSYQPAKPTRSVSPAQFKTRHFICDHCHHYFTAHHSELSKLSGDLHCPKCKKTVIQLAP